MTKILMNDSTGVTPNRGIKYRRGRLVGDFRPIAHYISETTNFLLFASAFLFS